MSLNETIDASLGQTEVRQEPNMKNQEFDLSITISVQTSWIHTPDQGDVSSEVSIMTYSLVVVYSLVPTN